MRFAEPAFAPLLALVPLALLFAWWVERRKRRDLALHFHPELLAVLSRGVSYPRRWLKWSLLALALGLFAIGLMRPQWGRHSVTVERRGIDIVFVIDVSKSMLAEDIKPSRLEKAKIEIDQFMDRLAGDRAGLVAFAGSAFTLCPLTHDYNAMKQFVGLLAPDIVARQGTDIGNALRVARRTFVDGAGKHKAIVLLTDGEDFNPATRDETAACAKDGIKIFTIGFGSRNGDPIPVKDDSGKIVGYHKDASGQIVVSRLDEKMLSEIAQKTDGRYDYSPYGDMDLAGIYRSLQSIEKRQLDSQKIEQFEERYAVFAAALLLLLVGEYLLLDRARPPRRREEEEGA
ncbi:MAG: VWA domain-containing protein [Spirochaetes bacterium]|nr:VWA domain-containing protein [Spirochaetota bacterium]